MPEDKIMISTKVEGWIAEEIRAIAESEQRTSINVISMLLQIALKARKKDEPLVVNS